MTTSSALVCANCHRSFDAAPLYVRDVAYCCMSCVSHHLCSCSTEIDLADDGVDGLGLPFSSDVGDEALVLSSMR